MPDSQDSKQDVESSPIYGDPGPLLLNIEDEDADFEFIDRHWRQSEVKPDKKRRARLKKNALVESAMASENLRQTRSIQIFAVITIMFLPLSFVTSVFGVGHVEVQGTDFLVIGLSLLSMGCIALYAVIIVDYYGALGTQRHIAAVASRGDEETSLQSAESNGAMLTFTAMTVLFLPISFINSPFGMNSIAAERESPHISAYYVTLCVVCIGALFVTFYFLWTPISGLVRKIFQKFKSSPDSRGSDISFDDEPILTRDGKKRSKYFIDRPAEEVQFSAARVAQSPDVGKQHQSKQDIDERSLGLRAPLTHPDTVGYVIAAIWVTWFGVWATLVFASCPDPSSKLAVRFYHYMTMSFSGVGWGLASSNSIQKLGWITAVLSSWAAHWYVGDVCGAQKSIDVANSLCVVVTLVLLHNWAIRVLKGVTDIPQLTKTAVMTVLCGVLLVFVLIGYLSGELDLRVKSWLFSCSTLGVGGLVGVLQDFSRRRMPVSPLQLELTPTARTKFYRLSDWMSISLQHSKWRLKDLFHTTKIRLEAWRTQILEPRLQADHLRIRFKCACGARIWDDYPVKLTSQALQLQQKLDDSFRQVESNAASARRPDGAYSISIGITSDLKLMSNSLKRWLLRKSQGPKVDDESQPPENERPTTQDLPHYLTCFPEAGDRRPRLVQVSTSEIQGDREYFNMLRKQARMIRRTWTRMLVPRKIKAIRYVQVSQPRPIVKIDLVLTTDTLQMHLLHDNEHVDVLANPEPQFPKNKEDYSPIDSQLEASECLYLGSNTLLHFFESQKDCCQYPHALYAIPKKLKGKLSVPPQGRPMIGWGMQLADGLDTFRLGVSGFAGLLVSSAVGVIWAATHTDVQGGSGIAQCLMYFVTFIVTVNGVSEVR